jgi:citrate synthase
MSAPPQECISTHIWQEEPEADNPFAARVAHCHGYDVFGEMLGNARWSDMLFLLFRGEAPSQAEGDLLESLAVALANPGPRDVSVHAAMCGGTGGSTAAACLMAALAAGAGQLGGGREVYAGVAAWRRHGCNLDRWRDALAQGPETERISGWPDAEHWPGFDPHGVSCATPVRQTLACLARISPGLCLPWLEAHRLALEGVLGLPLALSGVAAAAYADLGFDAEQAEMLHLLLRLPGAAAHALEQKRLGHKKFPFFAIELAAHERNEP